MHYIKGASYWLRENFVQTHQNLSLIISFPLEKLQPRQSSDTFESLNVTDDETPPLRQSKPSTPTEDYIKGYPRTEKEM